MFLCPNNLLTVYKSAPNVNIMVAWVCLASKRLRDSILSPFFHSYIFAMYKNEALWI